MFRLNFFCFILIFVSTYQSDAKERIVSLSPPITEEIYLLGLGENIVANTIYCTRPKEAEKKEKVGSVVYVNVEAIVRLKPDIVFASPLTDRRALERLKKLGIRVVVFPHPKGFEDLCKNFLTLAKILGKEREAQEILNIARKRLEELKKRYGEKEGPTVLFQIGSKPLFVANRDSIVHSYLDYVGGRNVAKDAKTGLFSREEVIKLNPEYIIIVTMGIEGEKEKESWRKFSVLRAVKENKIYLLDSYKLCSPTPLSYVEVLDELASIFYGEKERR